MINELIKLATHLDSKGYHKEADYIDKMLNKEALLTKEAAVWPLILLEMLGLGFLGISTAEAPDAERARELGHRPGCTGWPLREVEKLIDMGTRENPRFVDAEGFPKALQDLIKEYTFGCNEYGQLTNYQTVDPATGKEFESMQDALVWNEMNNKAIDTGRNRGVFGYGLNALRADPEVRVLFRDHIAREGERALAKAREEAREGIGQN